MAVNLSDYSRNAAAKGWGSGWPNCVAGGDLAIVTADRSGVRFSVRKRIAVLVDALIDWTEANGFLLKSGQCGAYNCRPIAGTNTPSNHSWAIALDINWQDNPFTTTGKHTIPQWMVAKWNEYGFAWGGNYSGAKKDYMHFEFMGTPADADAMTAKALRELRGSAPAPVNTGGKPILKIGSSGDAVKALQAKLNKNYPAYSKLVVDGAFGPGTDAVVKEFQRRSGLTADGIVGPATYAKLGM